MPDTLAAPTSRPRPLWRNRDYLTLWTGDTISTLGSSMSSFVFPIVTYAMTGSTTQAALVGTARLVGSVGGRLPAGVLVDRWNRRAVLAGSELSGAVLYGSLVAAIALGHLRLGLVMVVALLTGVSGAFGGPAATAALRTVVPAGQLPTALSQNEARMHAAGLVGPPVGGLLLAVGRAVPFLADAVSYLVGGLAALALRTPLPAPERDAEAPTGMRREIVEGLRFLMSRPFFRATMAFAVVVNFAVAALFIVLTLKLLQAGVQPAAIGAMEAAGSVAGIAGALLTPALMRRFPTGWLTIVPALVLVVALTPMAFTDNVVVIGVLLAAALAGLPVTNTGLFSYLVAITPDRLQGRVNAALMFSATAIQPLGPVLGGFLLAAFGGTPAMLVMSALMAVAVVPLVASREVRTLPRADRWPTDSSA